MDKQITTSGIVVSFLFLGQLFFFMPSMNVVPVYLMFFLYSAFMTEEKKKVIIIKKQRYGGMKSEIE